MKRIDWLLKPFKWFVGYVTLVLAGIVSIAWYVVALPVVSIVQMIRFLFGKKLVMQIRQEDNANLYYSKNHLRIIRSNSSVAAGPDKLILRLIGAIDSVSTPSAGTKIEAGSPLVNMEFEGKSISLTSPVSGKVLEVNSLVLEHPEVLSTMDPAYLWVVRVQPDNFASALANLVPREAFGRLSDAFRSRLMDFFAPDAAVARTDGGAITRGLARQMSNEDWNQLKSQLFTA